MKIFIILLAFIVPSITLAAQVSVEIPRSEAKPGETFIASLFIDTEEEWVNAVEGMLHFPSDLFLLESIRDGGSFVTVWLEKPHLSENGSIFFSGITPGGYSRERGFLFSAVFRTADEGQGRLSLTDVMVLLNDGLGTGASVSTVSPRVAVSSDASLAPPEEPRDTEPPESFSITFVKTPDAFEGHPFIVFAATDKGTGTARYEICEGIFRKCALGESPYRVRSTDGHLIRVTAIDASGNQREAVLFTPGSTLHYGGYLLGAILIIVGGLFLLRRFSLR